MTIRSGVLADPSGEIRRAGRAVFDADPTAVASRRGSHPSGVAPAIRAHPAAVDGDAGDAAGARPTALDRRTRRRGRRHAGPVRQLDAALRTYDVPVTTVVEPEGLDELSAPIPPRRLIVSVYGLYARERGGRFAVASLVRLLGDLGVDGQAVRSAVSRLKRRGLLEPEKVDGAAGYRLSAEAAAVLDAGDERIFGRRRAGPDEGWLLVAFSVPESARDQRHQLRSLLTRLGLGTVAPGLWVAPAHVEAEVSRALERAGLRRFTELFRSRHVTGGRPLPDVVAAWWDLDALDARYRLFLNRHEPVAAGDPPPAMAFAELVRVVTDWRRLPYLDPGLPLDALPRDWVGVRAEDLFGTLRARLSGPAREHVTQVLDG